MATNNNKPVGELRIGAVKAAVWENQVGGFRRHNVTFTRLYRDGDQWKTTDGFGLNDLLTLAKVADRAHSLIVALNDEATENNEAA